ncbi:peptidyl-tRNA hydrolase [bacterium]|nr:peptidyl-tRNA hydrolase [bacterium]
MKILVGLGNPGKEFEKTPHNAGFIALDLLVRKLQSMGFSVESWHEIKKEKSMVSEVFSEDGRRVAVLVKPQTFMNLSGGAVQQVMAKYGVKSAEDVMIIYDELDITLGEFKYSPIKNSRTHKGISSVISTVGKAVHSLRIGVENRANKHIPGQDYVVRSYSEKELLELSSAGERAIEQHVLDFLELV